MDKVNWVRLCKNINAIHILEKNLDKVDWYILSLNPNAMTLLETNMDKVNWALLAMNPNTMHLFKSHPHNAYKYRTDLSTNPSIFEIDTIKTYQKGNQFAENLSKMLCC